jgi:glycosyltransferase involved in cell wall biosynthesis
MKILAIARQRTACGYYRVWLPARIMREMGHEVDCWEYASYYDIMKPNMEKWVEDHIGEYDIILSDRCITEKELGLMAGLRHHSPNARLIVDFDDDFCNAPWWNESRKAYMPGMPFREVGLQHMKLAEMTVVSTKELEERFKDKSHRIHTSQNLIDPGDWLGLRMNPDRPKDPRLRILYGGASGHFGDLDEAQVGLQAVLENPPVPIRLVALGAMPSWMHDMSRRHPDRVINIPWVPDMRLYAQAIAWGGFDVALAPLADHPFNTAKSNIKWLEAAMQGIPLLCSNIGPYAEIPDGCAIKVDNSPVQWAEGLRELLKNEGLREKICAAAFGEVMENWTLDKGKEVWDNILDEASKAPRILTLEDTMLPADL